MNTFAVLIFLSSCAWGFECVHEIKVYPSVYECSVAQKEFEGYRTLCAVVTENENQEFDLMRLGEALTE
jgi:hypothetical protein